MFEVVCAGLCCVMFRTRAAVPFLDAAWVNTAINLLGPVGSVGCVWELFMVAFTFPAPTFR